MPPIGFSSGASPSLRALPPRRRPSTPRRAATSLEVLLASAGRSGVALAPVFGWIFAAAVVGLVLSFVFLIFMEERPLRSAARPAEAPVAAE